MQFWTRLTGYSRMVERRFGPIGGLVSVPHGNVHYLADGPSRGLPLVLLHGASGNLRDWTLSLMPTLARRHRVIALDRPGFGHSTATPGAVTLAGQIDTLSAALHRLGVQRYVLAGHSYSGALALAWALRRPAEVAGIGLVAGVAMDWGGALGPLYRIGGAPVIGQVLSQVVPVAVPLSMIDTTLAEIFAPQPVPELYRSRAGAELALRPQTFRTNFRAVNTLHGQVVRQVARYPSLACPVEIVHGAEDTVVPARVHALPLSRTLPDAALTLIDGTGHMPHHTDGDAVAAAIDRLMERARAASPHPS